MPALGRPTHKDVNIESVLLNLFLWAQRTTKRIFSVANSEIYYVYYIVCVRRYIITVLLICPPKTSSWFYTDAMEKTGFYRSCS